MKEGGTSGKAANVMAKSEMCLPSLWVSMSARLFTMVASVESKR